ncbi:MAG: hypothetical protein WA687_02610 [Solirubrobacterales bacterium]
MSASPSAAENGSTQLSRRQTVRMVSRHIAEGRPIAVVRFGEGEARLLAADPANPTSMKAAIKKLRRQSGLTFSAKEMLKVKALLMNALDEADVVGLRTSKSFAEEHRELGELIASVYAERVAQGRRPGHLAHSLLNSDLCEALPALLAGQQQLSVVSCRDIGPILKADHNLTDITAYQVPSQYVVRDVDGPYEAALHDVPIWPEFYQRLRAELTVRSRGEVFLVGAGLFGKDLCIRIRELGGIALDMGSTLDAIASKVTRGRNRPTFRAPPEIPRLV